MAVYQSAGYQRFLNEMLSLLGRTSISNQTFQHRKKEAKSDSNQIQDFLSFGKREPNFFTTLPKALIEGIWKHMS